MTSSEESMSTSGQQAKEKVKLQALNRIEESVAPSLGLGRLVALDNLQKVFAGARRRVEDSHKSQMLKLQEVTGNKFDLTENTEDEEVAISVSGDTTNHYDAPRRNTMGGAALALLSAAGLPLAGIGAYKLMTERPTPPAAEAPAFVPQDRDTHIPYSFSIE